MELLVVLRAYHIVILQLSARTTTLLWYGH